MSCLSLSASGDDKALPRYPHLFYCTKETLEKFGSPAPETSWPFTTW